MRYALAPLRHPRLVTVASLDAVPAHRLVVRPRAGRLSVYRRTPYALVLVGTFAHLDDAAAAMSRWI